MPNFEPPRSDTARVAFLNSAFGAAKSDKLSGKEFILEDSFEFLRSFSPKFEKKVTTLTQNLSERSKEIEERNSSLSLLSTYVRDGFEVARRQVNRLDLPVHVLNNYGLPQDGVTPYPATPVEWLTIAKTFVEGANKVKELGLPTVDCPSPEEIEQIRRKAEKEYKDVSSADRGYDDAQAGIADMRQKADELIGDIMAELRLTLRKLDYPSQRRIMRSYGARFKYLQGEEVDQDDNEPVTDEVTTDTASE